MSETKGVEAVERALKILECFDGEVQELSLAEIAAFTGFYKSTILRLAVSLERFGYLVRRESGQFRLGAAAWKLGRSYQQNIDLADILRPELKRLSDQTQETASFYVREGDSRICLYRSEPVRAIRHAIIEGERLPLELGASGKVLIAFGEGSKTGTEIRDAGFATSLGERDADVAAVSVPLMSITGQLAGALSVSGLITRFTADQRERLLAALKASQTRLAGRI